MADFPWCRLYNDVLKDRKLERIRRMTKLPRVVIRGAFMSMMAMANDSPQRGYLMLSPGVWMGDDEICDDLEMDPVDFEPMLAAFISLGMVTRHEHGGLQLTNFDKRQFKSDLSTRRVQQHRAKAKKADETPDPASYATPGNTTETLQQRYGNASDTDTETDVTETETDTDAPSAPEPEHITPGPEPPNPAPTLTQQEVAAYLEHPDPELAAHWATVRLDLQGQAPRQMFDQWYAPLKPLVLREGILFLAHPTEHGQQWCTSRLKIGIDRTVRAIVPGSMECRILVGGPP